MKFKNDLGRSMFEMVLYLGLIVVITTSTISMYSESVEKTRNIQADSQIEDIQEKVNLYYLGRPFPSTGQIETVLQTKLGNQINLVDPWGSKITVYANKTGAGAGLLADPYFGIKFSNLDKKRCINVSNLFIQKGAVTVEVNETKKNTSFTISDAAKSCTRDGATNAVQGFFKKD